MVLSDEGKQDIAGFVASLMHLVVVPRQDEGRTETRHPARRRLGEEDVHLGDTMHLRALDEDEISRWNRGPKLMLANLYLRRALGDSRLEGAARPKRKRLATAVAH
jgi:hypothetical protein